MTTKVSPRQIISDHFATLRNHRTDKWSALDVSVMFGLPVAAAVAAGWFNVQVVELNHLIAGVSILTGFAFALLVYVFQLRLEASRDGFAPKGGPLASLLSELFTNVAYACVVGLVLVTLLVAGGAIGPAGADAGASAGHLGRTVSALSIGVALHFLLTLLMCIKRTYVAFDRSVKHT